MAEISSDYVMKVGRDADRAKEAFNLWANSTHADFRGDQGATREDIRRAIISVALTR